MRVFVEDAAGNRTTAYGPATKLITHAGPPDPGPLNGSPATPDARLRARWDGRDSDTRSVRYNARPTLSGQLTTATGQPIRDAVLRVNIKRDARNSPEFERDSLRTNADGRFRWKLPAGVSSQAIRLAYHHYVRDAKPVATRTLKLKVSAGLRLSLSRKTARRGQTVKLSGRLLGRPLPSIGKTVELQARNRGGKWITFRTVRTKKNGTFKATYRFRRPGPATFQMRARARRAGDYPYATGASSARTIRVR